MDCEIAEATYAKYSASYRVRVGQGVTTASVESAPPIDSGTASVDGLDPESERHAEIGRLILADFLGVADRM